MSFVVSLVMTVRNQPWAFFGLHTRMWQLGGGALLAVAWPYVGRIPTIVRRVAPVVGIVAIVMAIVIFDSATPWPGTAALVPTLATLAVLVGGDVGPVAHVLGRRPAIWLGGRSYSWYLWHWPALVLLADWRGRSLGVPLAVAVAVASLVVAEIGYRYVEQPIRHRRAFVHSPRRSLAVGLALSVTCLVGLAALRATTEHVDATGPAVTVPAVPPADGLPAFLEAAAGVDAVPSNLDPALGDARADLPSVYGNGCHADIPDTEPKICELGDPAGASTVVLIGDSHAAQWVPALDQAAAAAGIRLLPFTKSGCSAFDVTTHSSVLDRDYTECDEWRANVLDLVTSMHPDQVIVTQASGYTPADAGDQDPADVILDGYVRVLDTLAAATPSVVVLSDTPYPAGDVPDCSVGAPRRRQRVHVDPRARAGAPLDRRRARGRRPRRRRLRRHRRPGVRSDALSGHRRQPARVPRQLAPQHAVRALVGAGADRSPRRALGRHGRRWVACCVVRPPHHRPSRATHA